MPVANIAHGVGAVLGALIAAAIVTPERGRSTAISMLVTLLVAAALIGATEARGLVNLSHDSAFEARLCYDALISNRNHDALRWGTQAVRIQPDAPGAWYNLGIAYQRTGSPQLAQDAYARAKALAPNDPTFAGATSRPS
jgi:Tfp pilus assembly protein PilF